MTLDDLVEYADRVAAPGQPRVVARGPLSDQQATMVAAAGRVAQPETWNVGLALALTGELDLPALTAALRGLVERHHALRTRFVGVDGDWVQEVLAAPPLPVPLYDLTGLPHHERSALADQVAREVVRLPFHLGQGDGLRARVVRLSSDEWLLILALHHISCDGWAAVVLVEDLAALYRAAVGAPQPEPPSMQAIGYAHWQRSQLATPATQRSLAYWLAELSDAQFVLNLPGHSRVSGRAIRHTFAIPPVVVDDARDMAQRSRTTLFAVLVGALGVLLGEVTGQRDMVLSVPWANRREPALQSVVTVAGTALPLRLRLDTDDFGDLVRQTGHRFFAGLDHALPGRWIVDHVQARCGVDIPRPLPVTFAYQNVPDPRPEMPGLAVEVAEITPPAERALVVSLAPARNGGLAGYLDYPVEMLSSTTVAAWTTRYIDLIARLCHSPQLAGTRFLDRRHWKGRQ